MREGLLNDDVIEHGVAEIVAAMLLSEILLIHKLSLKYSAARGMSPLHK